MPMFIIALLRRVGNRIPKKECYFYAKTQKRIP